MSTRSVLSLIGFLGAVAASAHADVLLTRSSKFEGRVLRVSKDAAIIRTSDAELSIPLAEIVREDIPVPQEFKDGVAAMRAGDYDEAVAKFRPLVERFAGLRTGWIPASMLRLGDAYLAQRDTNNARKTYTDFQNIYAKTPEAVAMLDVKFAQLEASQKKFTEAMAKVKPVLEGLLKKTYLTDSEEMLLSQALVLQGDCLLADNKKEPALDSFLRVVTLYDIDPSYNREALYKAGKIFEGLGNWQRARDCYRDLLADAPTVAFADDAKKRLDAITQAHPE